MKSLKPSREEWVSLEQVAETLGLPWVTVWRWARDGDPRLPAYRTWDERARDQVHYRFKKQDVEALQAQMQPQEPVSPPSEA